MFIKNLNGKLIFPDDFDNDPVQGVVVLFDEPIPAREAMEMAVAFNQQFVMFDAETRTDLEKALGIGEEDGDKSRS